MTINDTKNILPDFQAVLTKIKNEKNSSILLGNGFVLAGEFTDLAQDKIFEKMKNETDKLARQPKAFHKFIKEKFDLCDGEINLEYYLKMYIYAHHAINCFYDTSYFPDEYKNGGIDKIKKIFKDDHEKLRKLIIEVIRDLHKDFDPSSNSGKFNICAKNILNFKRIFTINYDLVLYWLIQKCNKIYELNHKDKHYFKDALHKELKGEYLDKWKELNTMEGVNLKQWSEKWNKINVYFLHGAIHLFSEYEGNNTFKICKDEGVELKLNDIAEEMSNQKNYDPLIILAGDEQSKKIAINNNPYLRNCLHNLSQLKDILVIDGCSIINKKNKGPELNNDKHLWRRIFTNKSLKDIYIGLYPDDGNTTCSDKDKISSKISDIEQVLKLEYNDFSNIKKKLHYYSTKKNTLWGQ